VYRLPYLKEIKLTEWQQQKSVAHFINKMKYIFGIKDTATKQVTARYVKQYKKFELKLTRRAKAYSSSCSVV